MHTFVSISKYSNALYLITRDGIEQQISSSDEQLFCHDLFENIQDFLPGIAEGLLVGIETSFRARTTSSGRHSSSVARHV